MPDPATTSTRHSPWQWPEFALAVVVLGFVLLNVLLPYDPDGNELLWAAILGVWVFQPMLFGSWMAIGPGRFATRAMWALPTLALVLVSHGLNRVWMADIRRPEFVVTMITGGVIGALICGMLLIVRGIFGLRVEHPQAGNESRDSPFQFTVRQLLWMTTIWACVLGAFYGLKFDPTPPPGFFGLNFYITVLAIGGGLLTLLLLPMLQIPLLLLCRTIATDQIVRAVAVWLCGLMVFGIILLLMEDSMVPGAIGYGVVAQIGAGLVGAAAALLLRLAGYRVVGRAPAAELSASDVVVSEL